MKKIKKSRTINTKGDNFTYMGTDPTQCTKTKFGTGGRVDDVIIVSNFIESG